MVTLRSYFLLVPLLAWVAFSAADAAADPPPAPAPAPAPAPGPEPVPIPKPKFEEGLITKPDGTVVYFYRTNFVGAAELVASAGLMNLQPAGAAPAPQPLGVKLTPFPAQNTVLVEGNEEAVLVALDLLAYFDVAVPQVFIEARVVEITHDSNFEYGLDLKFNTRPDSTALMRSLTDVLRPPSAIASALPGGLPFQGTTMVLSQAINMSPFTIALQALRESGKAEILSKPSILCTQGIEAKVTTTEAFEVNRFLGAQRTTNTNNLGEVQNVSTNEQYGFGTATTGVSLTVTAKHIGDAFVTLDLSPSVSGVAGTGSRLGGTTNPVITTRSAKTTVTLGNGETLVIAGLFTNRVFRQEGRTPLLSDLPLLGTLFTRQQELKQKSELMFILTPRIVRKNTDARVIVPPAELERLEQKPSDEVDAGPCGGCGPCAPTTSMEEVLYPRQRACREMQQRAAKRDAAAPPPGSGPPAGNGGSPPPGSGPSSSPPPPPPPPPAVAGPSAAPPHVSPR